MNIRLHQSPSNEKIYEVFEYIVSFIAISVCTITILATLIMKKLRCNIFCSTIRFMAFSGIGTEILKILNLILSSSLSVQPTICPLIAITSNGFWLWQDFLMVLYIIRIFNYILRNNQKNSTISNIIERWDFLIHILIFLFSFSLFALTYLIFLQFRINLFKYDPVVKRCEFDSKVNMILVTTVESLIFLVNLILILLIIFQVAKLKAYNQDERAPIWTKYISMSLYPLIWGCTFFIVCFGMILSSKSDEIPKDSKLFFDYIYLFFGPRFQTSMILFTTGIVINKIDRLDFKETIKDIEYLKNFKVFLGNRDWLIQCYLDFYLLKDQYQLYKRTLYKTYSYEDEFLNIINMSESEFFQRVDFEFMIRIQNQLEDRLITIWNEEYISSEWFKESKVILHKITENDSYVPLIYFIIRFGLCFKCCQSTRSKLNLKMEYAKQIRGLFPKLKENL